MIRYLTLIVLMTTTAFADTYLCDGVWTTERCDKPQSRVRDVEVVLDPNTSERDEQIKNMEKKRVLIRDIQSLAYQASKKINITIPTGSVVNYCFEKTTSYEDCEAKVKEKEAYIKDLVINTPREQSSTEVKSQTEPAQTNNVTQVVTNEEYYVPICRTRECLYGNRPEISLPTTRPTPPTQVVPTPQPQPRPAPRRSIMMK